MSADFLRVDEGATRMISLRPMATLRCPSCRLYSPASAGYCDCGYEFVQGSRPHGAVVTAPRFWGSTIALVLGCLTLASAVGNILVPDHQNPFFGFVLVFGALAYRSAKQRGFGIKADTKLRRSSEIVMLVIALLIVVLQSDLGERSYQNPLFNVVIPIWVFVAYGLIVFRRSRPLTLSR